MEILVLSFDYLRRVYLDTILPSNVYYLYISTHSADHSLTPPLIPMALQRVVNDLYFEYLPSRYQICAPAPA